MENYSSAGVALCLCIGAWLLSAGTRPLVRSLMRGAVTLSVLLAVSQCLPRLPDLTLMLPTLTLTVLTLAVYTSFRRALPLLLLLTILTGAFCISLCAEFLALPGLILVVQLPAAGIILIIARKGCVRFSSPSILLVVSAMATLAALCAGFSAERMAPNSVLLFSTVGLMGISVAVNRISDTSVSDIHRMN